MSKAKAILKYGLGIGGMMGAVGTVTGHGLVHIISGALGVRLNSGQLNLLARFQIKNAQNTLKEAGEEWNKSD